MKIMVCYNGTEACKKALKRMREFLKVYKDSIILLVTSMKNGTEREVNRIISLKNDLEHEKTSLEKEGVACETHLLIRGLPDGKDLLDFAQSNKVDSIFLGIKKRSILKSLIFGSTGHYIMQHSRVPVVAVK